jgi:ankyrin repeat protein
MFTTLHKKAIVTFTLCVLNISLQAMDPNYSHLQLACLAGDEKNVEQLIKDGHHVNIKVFTQDVNNPGRFKPLPTPLHCAAQKGHVGIIKLLLNAGADINSKHCDFDATPLHTAVWFNRSDSVKSLKEHGAKLDIPNSLGSIPLHLATCIHDLACLEELLKENSLDFNYKLCTTKNHEGNTAIDLAKMAKFSKGLKKLREIINSFHQLEQLLDDH